MKPVTKILLIAAGTALAFGIAALALRQYSKASAPKFADHLTAAQQKTLAAEFTIPQENGNILCAGYRERNYRIEAGAYPDSRTVLDALPFLNDDLREQAAKEIENPVSFESGYQPLTGETVSAYRIYSPDRLEGKVPYDVYIFSRNEEWFFDMSKGMIEDDRFFQIFASQ